MEKTWADETNGTIVGTLPHNGLKIVMKKLSKEPNAMILLHFSFGSNSELTADERGMAHMMEHSWFKGSKDGSPVLSEVDVPEIARALGAEFNAYTSTNKTCYYFKTANRQRLIDPFVSIMGTLMQHASLKSQHMKSEKLAVLQEMARGKDNIVRDALIEIRKGMYSTTEKQDNEFPQFYPTIGNIADIANSTSTMMRNFYNRLYRPENATLFIVGDIDTMHMKKHIENAFAFPLKPIEHNDDSEKIVPPHLLSTTPIIKQKYFPTLEQKQSLIVLGYRTGAANSRFDVVSNTLKTLLLNGSKSRLHQEIVLNEEMHINSVGGFAVRDRNYGEFFLFFDGTDNALQHIDEIEKKVKLVFGQELTDNEWIISTAATNFGIAGRETDIESYTKAWSDDFQVTQDPHNYDEYQRYVVSDDTRSMVNEQMKIFASQKPHIVSYRACTPDEAAKLKEERITNNRYFTNMLQNEEHKRVDPIEEPNSLALYTTPEYTQERPATQPVKFLSKKKTMKVMNPDFEFYRHISVPKKIDRMQQAGHVYCLSLLNEVVSETFPQITFMKHKLKCSLSPIGASVTSIKTNKFMNVWRKRFANGFSNPDMKKITIHYLVHKKRFEKKWNSDLEASKMNPMSRLFDVAQATCSDNYVPKRNHKTSMYDFHKAVIDTFDIEKVLHCWNSYYHITDNIYISKIISIPSQIDEYHLKTISYNLEPTVFDELTETKRETIVINEGIPLNQSIVALVRPGSYTKKDPEYHTLRPIAQNLLFRSIGSRLFKIRESTGLFYTASGGVSVGATNLHKGIDFVLCKINPDHIEEAVAQMREFVTKTVKRPVSTNEFRAAQRMHTEQWRSRNTETNIASNWSQNYRAGYGNPFELPEKRIQQAYEIRSDHVTRFLEKSAESPFMLEIVCI